MKVKIKIIIRTDLKDWPKELISGAINSLFDTRTSGMTHPSFDMSLGNTKPPSNTNSLVSEQNFSFSACATTLRENHRKYKIYNSIIKEKIIISKSNPMLLI